MLYQVYVTNTVKENLQITPADPGSVLHSVSAKTQWGRQRGEGIKRDHE